MEDDRNGGYSDKLFVGEVPKELICPICICVVREAYQSTCCGALYCDCPCLTGLESTSKKCALCREELNCFEDKACNRRVRSLAVKCDRELCKWTGELGQLENHQCKAFAKCDRNYCQWTGELWELQQHQWNDCDSALLDCKGCCDKIRRDKFEVHIEHRCNGRTYTCVHCNTEGTYQFILGKHVHTCEVACEDCHLVVRRKELTGHKASCPKQIVSCKYKYMVKCFLKCAREKMEEHEKSHNIIMMEKFEYNNIYDKEWYSPPFYSHPGKYKMCMRVYAKGEKDAIGTHLSLWLHMMRGENDDNLEWPFQGEVSVTLLNQQADNNHKSEVIRYQGINDTCNKRVIRKSEVIGDGDKDNVRQIVYERRMVIQDKCVLDVRGDGIGENGYGVPRFIPHSELNARAKYKYLKDDTLYFKVNVIG